MITHTHTHAQSSFTTDIMYNFENDTGDNLSVVRRSVSTYTGIPEAGAGNWPTQAILKQITFPSKNTGHSFTKTTS